MGGSHRVARYIVIGAARGLLYYILVYVILLGALFNYIIPSIMGGLGEELGEEPSRLIGYEMWNYGVMAMFIVLSIIGTLLRNVVPYGFVLDGLVTIGLIYYSLSLFNFGRINVELGDKDIHATLDISPIMYKLFIAVSLIIIGGILVRTEKYREKRREIATAKGGAGG